MLDPTVAAMLHRYQLAEGAIELLEALRAFSKAFQPSLHRNGEQTAAIIGARDLLARFDA